MDQDRNEYPKLRDARCPGPSMRDIVLADRQDIPEYLLQESYQYIGSSDIDYDRYISEDFFNDEARLLWNRVWQWVCREEHIPEVGDYIVYDIVNYSFIIVRTEDGIKASHNACLHRGTQLRHPGSGSTDSFRCPFHGWTWGLDGKLADIPCRWDFGHVVDEKFTLPEAKVSTWGGFVFLNMDPDCGPLEEYLGVLPSHLRDGSDLAGRHIVLHVEKELPTNWKAAQEAFLEAYHVMETHAHMVAYVADANAQYDVFDKHVSRFFHAFGSPSPHLANVPSEQDIIDKFGQFPKGTKLPDGMRARQFIAQHFREVLGAAWGIDLSSYSDSEMIDSIEYQLFPNMCLFPGISLPMIYRFRPLDGDVSRTLFEILFLKPLKSGDQAPYPPDPIRITAEQSFKEVAGMDLALAHVYDQDTDNLAMQYRGFVTSHKRGQTIGNYQEIRIRHFNKIIDEYLSV